MAERMTEKGEGGVKDGDIAIPGEELGSETRFAKGPGTVSRSGKIYSVLVGKVRVMTDVDSKPVLSVMRSKPTCLRGVPSVGSLTVCQVVNITERQAKVSMLCVRNTVLPEPMHGIIRREDVRAMEKDTVELFHSFRPRDLVRARVIANGEGQVYVLSTAENELGVVGAKCECGNSMLPVSWCEMQCSKDGTREKRKVAKVVNAIPVLM